MMLPGVDVRGRAIAIYGIWESRFPEAERDLHWREAILVMYNSVEILLYTIGGSLVVFSRYLVGRVAHGSGRRDPEGCHRDLPGEHEQDRKGAKGQVWYLRSFDMSRSEPVTARSMRDPGVESIMRDATDVSLRQNQDRDSLFEAEETSMGEKNGMTGL